MRWMAAVLMLAGCGGAAPLCEGALNEQTNAGALSCVCRNADGQLLTFSTPLAPLTKEEIERRWSQFRAANCR